MVSAAAAAFPFRDERRKLCQATISTPPTRSNRQPCTPDHQASRLASKHHLGMLCDTRGQGAFLNRHHVFSFWLINEFSGRSVHSDMSKCIANNPLCARKAGASSPLAFACKSLRLRFRRGQSCCQKPRRGKNSLVVHAKLLLGTHTDQRRRCLCRYSSSSCS